MEDDDDGFVGYVPTTVDPGPWVLIGTAVFCSLSILLFPCMVSMGRRYEKRRMAAVAKDDDDKGAYEVLKEIEEVKDKEARLKEVKDEEVGVKELKDEEVGADEEIATQDEEVGLVEPAVEEIHEEEDKRKLPKAGSWSSSSFDVSFNKSTSAKDDENVKPHEEKKRTSEAHSKASSDAPNSFDHFCLRDDTTGDNKMGGHLQGFIDRLIMPPYPDDAGSKIDIRRRSHSDLSGRDDDNTVTILDAGAAHRNRHAGARRYRRGQKDIEWKREQEQERRISMMARKEVEEFLGNGAASAQDQDGPHSATSFSSLEGPSNPGIEFACNTPSADAVKTSYTPRETYCGHNSQGPFLRRTRGTESNDDGSSLRSFLLEDNVTLSPEDAIDAKDPGKIPFERVSMEGEELDVCCGDHAWWKPVMLASMFDRLLEVAEWDSESKRILNLSVPFSVSAIVAGVSETVRIALVAHFIGTDAVAAYTIVLLILGLTQEFFGGFALTSASLCSHAVGRKNYKLAGECVQISSILYTLFMIPNILVWMFFTDDVVRLFGFNEATVEMAQRYARYAVATQWFEGMDEAYGSLLEVIGHERFTMSLDIANEVFSTSIILASCLAETATLTDIGIIELGTEALFYGFSVSISNLAGWVSKYMEGMIHTNALRNLVAVRTVFRTAVPLALGQLLEYGEWEVLTIFVAFLGPAEVTTWGIAGSLWDTLEALTEGFGDAGEIRVAYHLGAGHPAKARMSSYKSILVSIIFATCITSIMWIIGEDLAVLLTPDPTLQRVIIEILPLMGIGNITMTAGTVSWALVGAQGRYRLATFMAFIGSWCVTLPLAAIYTYAFHIDLQGVTSAVVLGNSVTGTCLTYILVRSDWERLSRILMELNDESESSSSSSSSSSSDSSSSSPAREEQRSALSC